LEALIVSRLLRSASISWQSFVTGGSRSVLTELQNAFAILQRRFRIRAQEPERMPGPGVVPSTDLDRRQSGRNHDIGVFV
jgi:hypothetical protein